MKRFLTCLPLCLGLVALPVFSSPSVPVHGGTTCGAAEPAADVSMMTRHAALKSAAEAAIAGEPQTPCRDGKKAPDRHAGHAAHRSHHEPATHRHAARGMCAAAMPAAALVALPELMLAHHGPGTPRAPLADLADAAPAGWSGPANAHC